MDMNTAVSLLNIKEDLMGDEVSGLEINQSSAEVNLVTSNGKAKQARSKRIKTEVGTYEKLLASAAKKLGYTDSELTAWLNEVPSTPVAVQRNALRLIDRYELDPYADEISINQYEDGRWQAFITIDGWSKLINSHPAFSGISFTESTELVGGIPTWIGCAIYRTDRVVPIEIKEYLCEIQTEHSIWKNMPRRMLRHRVITQCARLAFGVSVTEKFIQSKNRLNSENKIKKENFAYPKNSQMNKLKIRLTKNISNQ